MEFVEELKNLANRIENLKDQISTEEATKTSFIMPFFQILGYDIFNPLEFVPEYNADFGIKKGEKVDYAILSNNQPIILVEAKWCGEPLDRHGNQLFRYFSVTKAKFGILTNGIEYRFYTDLDEINKMDLKPFFIVNLLNLKEQDIIELKKFHKNNFDVQSVFSAAENLKYTNLIKNLFAEQLEEPDDAFVNYVLSEIYDGRRKQSIIDKFAPIVKKSFNQFINDLLNDRIKMALDKSSENNIENNHFVQSTSAETNITSANTETTLTLIRKILSDTIDPQRIQSRECKHYITIQLDGRKLKWICRLYPQYKKIAFFDEKKYLSYFPLETPEDIINYQDKLLTGLQRVYKK